MDASISDADYQDRILPHVSRTFALTIPQLPLALRGAVTNAYLLCRVADTIEDETVISAAATLGLLHRFVAVLYGREPAPGLVQDVLAQLSERTLPAERELVLNTGRVIAVTGSLRPPQRLAIQRCVEVMCAGMHQFQRTASLRGLATMNDLNDYCFYVAGVVGQMLTELFCDYSGDIGRQRAGLQEFAVSFAQGLQMTNILKDVWEDRSRGACWLPQDVFTRHGVDLGQLTGPGGDSRFDAGMRELIGIAHGHLRNALSFTLLIPARERGIRRFCLWAIGLAVLTLQRIARTPGFNSGAQVKVSRRAVAMTQLLTNLAVRSDWMLRGLFERAASGLPLAPAAAVRRSPPRQGVQPARALAEPGAAALEVLPERAARRSEGRSGH